MRLSLRSVPSLARRPEAHAGEAVGARVATPSGAAASAGSAAAVDAGHAAVLDAVVARRGVAGLRRDVAALAREAVEGGVAHLADAAARADGTAAVDIGLASVLQVVGALVAVTGERYAVARVALTVGVGKAPQAEAAGGAEREGESDELRCA
jgi:hypothetical protein